MSNSTTTTWWISLLFSNWLVVSREKSCHFFVGFVLIVSEDAQSPPTHTVVFCNGHIFTFDLYDSNRLLTLPEICQRLEKIVQQSKEPGQGIGALTALPRDDWADVNENEMYAIVCEIFRWFRFEIICIRWVNRIERISKWSKQL